MLPAGSFPPCPCHDRDRCGGSNGEEAILEFLSTNITSHVDWHYHSPEASTLNPCLLGLPQNFKCRCQFLPVESI